MAFYRSKCLIYINYESRPLLFPQLKVEHLDQLIPSKVVMLRNAIKDGLECPDLERIVPWDGHVMFALNLGGQSHMRARLAALNISESAQSLGYVLAADVTRQPHRVIISSRT